MLIILAACLGVALAVAVWQFSRARSLERRLSEAEAGAETLRRQEAEARAAAAEAAPRISRLEAETEALRQQLASEQAMGRERLETQRAESVRALSQLREHNEALVAELRQNADMQAASLAEQLADVTSRLHALNEEHAKTLSENSRLKTSLDHLNAEATEREQQLKTQFQNLANDILRENSDRFKAQNAERLTEILTPLVTNIDEFKRAVRESQEADTKERSSLAATIAQLRALNDSVMQETRNLTAALRGNNQVQGDWGEMVLESILAASGLTEGREYTLQATTGTDGRTLRDDEGRGLRPDVVVNYPDGSRLVIDAKTNLSHYFDSLDTSLPEEQRAEAARLHAVAVRAQVDGLARRDYSAYVGESRIDMVMMFIPNEPAYMTAMHADPKLWDYAYSRKVLIVSPTHLVAALRLIKNLWVRNQVTTNALEIARVAGTMYDKFAAFTSDLENIRASLTKSNASLDAAFSKLATGRGNLLGAAERLRKLGAKTQKTFSATVQQMAHLDAEALTDGEEG
ncbi:MAG: DNA recombination protein RmuC [Duncaniella sp.]|nr:DNA recombination protein RmuC [Duncaniella sp.]